MKKMKKSILLITVICVLTLFAGCQKAEQVNKDDVSKYSDSAVQKMMTAINEGNYSKFSEDFDSAMKSSITEQKFTDFASKIKSNLGEYKSAEITKAEKAQQYTRAYYNLTFSSEKDAVPFKFTFSEKDGKMLVSGIFTSSSKLK